eukprot:402383_1
MSFEDLQQLIPNVGICNVFRQFLNQFDVHTDVTDEKEEVDPEEPNDCISIQPLQNLVNTCFFNTALQSLLHGKAFVEYFLSDKQYNSRYKLLNAWKALCHRYYLNKSKRRGIIKPRYLLNCLAEIDPNYNNRNQECCYFLLLTLLNTLDDQLLKNAFDGYEPDCLNEMILTQDMNEAFELHHTFLPKHNPQNASIIRTLMHGITRKKVSCAACKHETRYYTSFRELRLPVIHYMVTLPPIMLFIIKNNKISKRKLKHCQLLSFASINVLKYKVQQLFQRKSKAKAVPTFSDICVYNMHAPRSFANLEHATSLISELEESVTCASITNATFIVVNFSPIEHDKLYKIVLFSMPASGSGIEFDVVLKMAHKTECITKNDLDEIVSNIVIKPGDRRFEMQVDEVLFIVYTDMEAHKLWPRFSRQIRGSQLLQTMKTKKLSELKDCLNVFGEEHVLDREHYAYFCTQCNEVSAIVHVKHDIVRIPPHLTLLLDRSFTTNSNSDDHKVDHHIHYTNSVLIGTTHFNLFAVANHAGYTNKSGHYYAFVKSIHTNSWFYASDSNVYQMKSKSIIDRNAIILMYEERA